MIDRLLRQRIQQKGALNVDQLNWPDFDDTDVASAEAYRYSIDRLSGEYGANVEQVAHRFTTLNRPGARGVPFFMLRTDPAGNSGARIACGVLH